mgnify:CR=1 FL=1
MEKQKSKLDLFFCFRYIYMSYQGLLIWYLSFIKVYKYYKRYDSFRNLLKFDLFIIEFLFWLYGFLRDFLIDNIKRFKEHFTDNFVYSITIGIVMIYGISIVANMIINFVLGGGSNDSANQLLFEDYLNNGALLMAFQSVILAPILEELLFRGLVFRSLRDKSKWLAIFAKFILIWLFTTFILLYLLVIYRN